MRFLVIFAFGLAALFPGASADDARPEKVVEGRVRALGLVHQGRFEQARELLERMPGASDDPGSVFFPAYVDYWTLIYDPENGALRQRFERQLDRTIAAADALPEHRAGEAEQWGGTAHLLLAQLRAWERRPFAAAFEAGRAKRLLDRFDRRPEAGADHLFALGTYNYMADRVPAYVKGLRALLFLPGGDEHLGLRQLETAAETSTYFRLDARLLLVTVHSHRKERNYAQAEHQMGIALERAGDTVVARHAAGRLALTLARPGLASRHLHRAIEMAGRAPRAHPAVIANLELLIAKVELAEFRPDLAMQRVQALLAPRSGVPPDVREDAEAVASEARLILEDAAWDRVRAVVVRDGAGEGSIPDTAPAVRLAREHPADPAAALMAGRALLQADEAVEASEWLRRAEASAEELPAPWIGPCRLMVGQALDLQGRRHEALSFYRRAADSAPFSGREAAHYWQTTPYRSGS